MGAQVLLRPFQREKGDASKHSLSCWSISLLASSREGQELCLAAKKSEERLSKCCTRVEFTSATAQG